MYLLYSISVSFNAVRSAMMEDMTQDIILSPRQPRFSHHMQGWMTGKRVSSERKGGIWNQRLLGTRTGREAVAMTMAFCQFPQSALWDQRRSDMTATAE